MPPKAVPVVIMAVALGLPGWARPVDLDTEKFRSEAEKFRLIERAAVQWNTVKAWRIEYEIKPSAVSVGIAPVHKIMAVSAPGEFYHMSAHFPPMHPWQMDPLSQEYYIHKARMCHRWIFNRAYSNGTLKPEDTIPGTTWMDFLLTIVPRWPLTEYKMKVDARSGTPVMAIEALRSRECRLLSGSELVAGEECDVFDVNGIDRIWVATSKGLCVMRREKRDPRSRRIFQRTLTEKVNQIAPGLWLPTEIRTQVLSVSRGTNDVIEFESKLSIFRCALNDEVPESTFIPIHPPGSIQFQNNGQFTQVSIGGEDLLDDIVNFMLKYAHLPTKPVTLNHPYGWLLGGLVSGLCIGLFYVPVKKGVSRKWKDWPQEPRRRNCEG